LHRKIRRSDSGNEYLGTLIAEGGFPARLISENSGWLPRYVQAVTVAAASDESSLDRALEHASFYQSIVPPYFRAASLIELTADLAHQVADLRRQVASHGFTGSAVEWLDSVKPGWREQLPIPADEAAAKRLVEGLVRASATKPVMPVTCRRLLRRTKDGWIPCIRLEIEGRIEDDQLPAEVRASLQSLNRARILPTGLLERRGLPAVGIANRTDEENWSGWQVTSLVGSRAITIDSYPFDADARFIFSTAINPAVDYVPTGGARITSDLLVFREERGSGEACTPQSLALSATASIKDRDPNLYVVVPARAQLASRQNGEASLIDSFEEKRLFQVTGALDIQIDDDHYVVIAGAEQSESVQIEAIGQNPERLAAHLPIYRGAPSFLIHHGVLKRKADANSLRMRIVGSRNPWTPFDAKRLPLGVVEVAAFAKDGAILDRLAFVHVPGDVATRLSIPAAGSCRIQIRGLAPAVLTPLALDGHTPKTERSGDCVTLTVAATGIQNADMKVRARWADSEVLLSIPVLGAKVAFLDATGRQIPNRTTMALAGLRGASIQAVEPSSALIEVREQGKSDKNLVIERKFESALPIAQVRDDIERLFSMTSDLDAVIRVDALQAGSSVATIDLRRFDMALEPDDDREVTLDTVSLKRLIHEGVENIDVYGRPFLDFDGEDHKLERTIDGSSLQWIVPEGFGPWFVYAKVDGITRSRPLHVDRQLLNDDGADPYIAAVTNANRQERTTEILDLLAKIGDGDDPASRDNLSALIASLDPALPPQAFDVFRLLPQRRAAAVHMIVNANEAAFERIIELDQKLPLSWPTTEPETWVNALNQRRSSLIGPLKTTGLADKMIESLTDAQTISRAEAIVRQRPNLAVHLAIALRALRLAPTKDAPERLRDATQALAAGADMTPFLQQRCKDLAQEVRKRNDERRWPDATTPFRLKRPTIATAAFEAPTWAHEVLDAPCAATAIALKETPWSVGLERMIRICRGFDPTYFDDALICILTIEWAKPGRKIAPSAA
jgi:hypothetical protein